MMKLKPLRKKGQIGLDVVRNVVLALLIISVLGVASMLALVSLGDAGLFTAGTTEATQTNNLVDNMTVATGLFFGNTGTIFSVLVVVVIISAIALVILVVRRFGGGGGI